MVAVVIPLLVFMPQIVTAAGVERYQWAAYLVSTSAAITRVLAIPGVNRLLAKYLPPLAAAPKAESPPAEAVRILTRPRTWS